MRPFPAQYIDNYAFYWIFGLGRLLMPQKGQHFNFILEQSLLNKKVVFLHKNNLFWGFRAKQEQKVLQTSAPRVNFMFQNKNPKISI